MSVILLLKTHLRLHVLVRERAVKMIANVAVLQIRKIFLGRVLDVRHDIRIKDVGYLCSWLGKSCEKHSDCCSQHCHNNVCHGARVFHLDPCYETIISSAIAVSGTVIDGDDVCPCTDLATDQIYSGVENSIDKSTGTEYTNNYPINSGIVATAPYNHAPVRKLKVCSNTACMNCDPTCYKLEGLCETPEDEWEFIQSGDLAFLNNARQTCTEINIIGRHQYSQYKITFPCIRGGWSECSGTPGSTPGPKEEWKPVQGEKKPLECKDSVKKLKNMEMTFIEMSYNSETDLTAFVYDFDNVLSHFTTDFWGDCEFAEYEYYLVNEDNGEVVYTGTPVLNVDEDDPDLCIKGAEFDTGGQVIYPHFHYRLAVKVKGQVSSVTGTYGIFQTPNWALYGEVEVPSCPVPPSCENYPMIVSDIDLLGKCNEVE